MNLPQEIALETAKPCMTPTSKTIQSFLPGGDPGPAYWENAGRFPQKLDLSMTSVPSLDQHPESWKVGRMKTTLDLPADLVREIKLRAAREGRKLKDVATEIVRQGWPAVGRPTGPSSIA